MAQIEKNGSYMALPMNIKRGNPIPVDTTMVWYSMTDLQEYAVSGATAYVGQIVTYVDEENSTVVAYMISNTAGTLIKLASTTASGDLAGDVATLQTQMANVLSTLEGLGALSTKDKITTAELAADLLNLINGKANSATTLEGYGITDAYTKTEIDGKLSGAFHYKGMVDYYTELTAKTDAQQGDVYIVRYTGTSGTTPLNAEYAWTGEAWEEFGGIIDLSGYQEKLTFDSTPTADSANPVTSGGVKTALDDKLDKTDAVGKKTAEGGEIFNYYEDDGFWGSKNSAGQYAHAEGIGTDATGRASHAEGNSTISQGEASHAEGYGTHANGASSHAEGNCTEVKETASDAHAEGTGTIASKSAQHVQGRFNIEDTTTNGYAHIVGNGSTPDSRSNAHTLDWDGNAWYAGNVTVGGTCDSATGVVVNAKTLATTEDVSNASTNATTAINEAKAELNQSITNLTTEVNKKVNNDKVAGTELGLVKSSTANNQVAVDENGVMTVNTITSDKISGSVATADVADKLSEARTISVSGDATGSASFDGSANADIAVTLKDSGVTAGTYTKVKVDAKGRVTEGSNITTEDVGGAGNIITRNAEEFATAEQGGRADTAVQSVNVAGTTKSGTSIEFTKTELKTNLGFIEATDDITFTNDVKAKATTKDSTDATLTTKGYVDQQITDKIAASNAMVYKGTVGTDGTVTTLPTENVINGDTYKVVTDGEYAGQQAFVGDMFIAVVTTGESGTSISWTRIPSGDDGNVSTSETLTANQLVVGNGNKEVKTLANGTKGYVLKVGNNGPEWEHQDVFRFTSPDSSIDFAPSGSGLEWDNQYEVTINQVSTDKLIQGTNVLILDGGSAE